MTAMAELENKKKDVEGEDALSLSYEEWRDRMEAWGEPRFRADQVCSWIYGRKIFNYHEMSNLSKALADPDDKLPEIVYWLMGSLDVWLILKKLQKC